MLLVLPTHEGVLEFKKQNPTFDKNVNVIWAQQIIKTVFRDDIHYDVFLLDDCHLMKTSEGCPLELLYKKFKSTSAPVFIFSYSKEGIDDKA